MLTEERLSIITDTVNRNKSVSISELCDILEASVSTIRRDLNTLAEMGKIVKVHGGAIALDGSFSSVERNIEEKSMLFNEEKLAIASFAAKMIDNGDFIFIDAGTSTEKLIDFIPQRNVIFVTNAFVHAKKLAQRGFQVHIPGGEIKLSTEAIVGAECVLTLKNYNFSKSFIGVNGISVTAGLTTPDVREAQVKTTAIEGSEQTFILADHSKFDKISSVTFTQLERVSIITDKIPDQKYLAFKNIKEVM